MEHLQSKEFTNMGYYYGLVYEVVDKGVPEMMKLSYFDCDRRYFIA